MDEIEERARLQLKVIEQSHSIKILNMEETAHLIAENVDDKRKVLMVCTSINCWIAVNNIKGSVTIPWDLVITSVGVHG